MTRHATLLRRATQLDFVNYINKLVEKNLNLLNMPTRSELDEVLKDLQEIKKILRTLKNGYEKLGR